MRVPRFVAAISCRFLAALTLFGAAMSGAVAQAPQASPGNHLTIGGFYTEPDDQRGVDYGIGFSAGYGIRWDERRWWELRGFTQVLETGVPGTDYYQLGGSIDLVQGMGNISAGHPFVMLGIGGALNDVTPDEADGGGVYGNAGLGWRFAPDDTWGLRPRLEFRVTYDGFDTDGSNGPADSGLVDVQIGFVLEIPPKRVVEKIVEKPVEKIVEVEKVVEKEVVREITPPPADSDGDGVVDGADKCPNTPAGTAVDGSGCVILEKVRLTGVSFASGSATLTAAAKATLDTVADALKARPEVSVEIAGHTDASGGDALNLKLSQRRADSARTYLISKDIAASRLVAKGYGETQPQDTNDTPEGRANNRRIEFKVTGG